MSDNSKILIVEDDPVGQLVITSMIKLLGHQADLAISGIDAVKRFDKNPYHLIFMDFFMPKMDGIEATQRIRKIEQEQHRTEAATIIALTARSMTGDKEQLLAAGMDDYLPKPLEFDQLKAILAKHLN